MFDERPRLHQLVERGLVHVVIVDAVLFTWPRTASRVRDGEAERVWVVQVEAVD